MLEDQTRLGVLDHRTGGEVLEDEVVQSGRVSGRDVQQVVRSSGDVKIGFFQQRSVYQTALDKGQLLKPAKTMDQMQQIITNVTVDGVLQALFALLTLIVVASAIPIWLKAAKRGGLPTVEVPPVPSHLVAPAEFLATAQEKQAVREYEASQRELAGSGRRR